MQYKTIYESKYANIFDSFSSKPECSEQLHNIPAANISEQDIKELLSNLDYVPIPGWTEKKEIFIQCAEMISTEYMIDLRVLDYSHRIVATYSCECDSDFYCLNEVISLADEMSFGIDGDKVLLNLTLYTHAIFSSGRKILPVR